MTIIKRAFLSNAINIAATGYAKKTWPIVFFLLLLMMGGRINAQTMYGTTGLLHAPTAEMQKDKTFMVGGNVLHLTPLHYFSSNEVKYTFNYYLNIPISRQVSGANIPIKTVLSMAVCGCGKKAGGSHGHHRLYLVRMTPAHMKVPVEVE